MPGPFHNNIRGTTAGTPGTGAFTPNAAAVGSSAWSNVPAGWFGLVRYEDASSAWELRFGYWNGTTISRPANGFHSSSSGSGLSLTSAATAELIIDAGMAQSHFGASHVSMITPIPGANSMSQFGAADTPLGTSAAATLATTNFLTEQPRIQRTSATTANAAAGGHMGTSPRCVFSTAAGRGGGEFFSRFGASQLPTGPRLWCGFETAINASTADPSSYTNILMFAKDSADTNIQFMQNDGSGTATKTDTGIPLAANSFYEARIWFDPGGAKAYGLLVRMDTGDIWFGSVTTNLPANGSLLIPAVYGSLSATTGTALIIHQGAMVVRTGG